MTSLMYFFPLLVSITGDPIPATSTNIPVGIWTFLATFVFTSTRRFCHMIAATTIYIPFSINLCFSNNTICIKQVSCHFHLVCTVCLLNNFSYSAFSGPMSKPITVMTFGFSFKSTFTIMELGAHFALRFCTILTQVRDEYHSVQH